MIDRRFRRDGMILRDTRPHTAKHEDMQVTPAYLGASEPQDYPGEDIWLRLNKKYPRGAPRVALALLAGWLVLAWLWGWTR